MKILVVVPTLLGGGAERVVSILTKEWEKSHQVTLVLFDASSRDYDYGGRIVDLRLPASDYLLMKICNYIGRTIRLYRVLRRERSDRILSFLERANFPSIAAAIMAGCRNRLYVSVRGDPSWLPFIYRILLPWIYRIPAGVIAVSEGVKCRLESMRVPAKRISVIPNPISGTAKDAVERKSVPPPVDRFILAVGRLSWEKGFDRLLTAFHALDQSDVHLVILGRGAEESALVVLARKLGIEKHVHFPGYVTDVENWYRNAECLVLSSRHEGWPNVLIEAMANGCPVVSFDCKYGPSEIIDHGENGLLVPEGDVEELEKAINRILGDDGLRRSLAAKAMERVGMLDAKEIALRWLQVRYLNQNICQASE